MGIVILFLINCCFLCSMAAAAPLRRVSLAWLCMAVVFCSPVHASVCTRNALKENDWCLVNGNVNYKVYAKDAITQTRNSKSVNELLQQWFKSNPSASRHNPECRTALSKYLCRSAMPPCDQLSSTCYAVIYPCKSMCTAALNACFPSGNPAEEKGGFGWLSCKYLPLTVTSWSRDNPRNETLTPVPTECCTPTDYDKGSVLPDIRSSQCVGNATVGAKEGVLETCGAAALFGDIMLVVMMISLCYLSSIWN